MSLLSPLFLLGLLGIALPIWLHRLQTQTTERERFSSAMFLEPSKKRVHIRRKLKYLLLMALRILFFILLAIAFARPSLLLPPKALVSEDSNHHVIVLDTSFSMSEGDRFERALARAEDIIAEMNPGDQSSLYSASSTVTLLADANEDQTSLRAALTDLSPSQSRLDIGIMVASLDSLIEESRANFILHVISDFQQTGQAARFADMIPEVINGRPVSLALEQLSFDNTPNLAIDSVQVIDRNSVRVGIKNYSSEPFLEEKSLTLSVNDEYQQDLIQSTPIPPEGLVYVNFNDVVFISGDNKVDVQMSETDSLRADDLRHSVFDNSPAAPVLLLTSEPESLSITYITAALEAAPRGYRVELTDINDLDTRVLQRYPWIVIDDLGAVNNSLAQALTDYLASGGSILTALGKSSQNLSTLPVSNQTLDRSSLLGQRVNYSINNVDTSHPALNRSLGWNTVNVSQKLTIELNDSDNALITLSDNSPLLIEHQIGLGSLLIFSTSLDNQWSDLPVKPVFVSFIAEAAQYLSKENILVKEQVIDSYLQLSQTGGTSGQVFSPQGESLLSLEATTQAQDILLNESGYYQVFTPTGEVLIAVNSDQRESDLTVMDVQTLQNWQNVVAGTTGTNASLSGEAIITDEDPQEMELWRILLALLVMIVFAESLLSNRYLNYKTA